MFKNARLVCKDADQSEYRVDKDRGSLEFQMSSSALRVFGISPSKWRKGWKISESWSLEYGSLLDCLVLTPGQFATRYAQVPSTYESKAMVCPKCKSVSDAATCRKCNIERVPGIVTKDWNGNSDTCRAWLEAQAAKGVEVVHSTDLEKAQNAKARLLADQQCRTFLESCDKQVWIEAQWHDKATGLIVPVKCLIDLAGRSDGAFPRSLGDLKSTKNAAPVAWASWAHKAGYDIQAAWNTDLFVAATGRKIENFCFILSESEAPFEIGRRFMTQDLLEPGMDTGDIASGRRQYRVLMEAYCQCIKNEFWPGYDDTDEASADGWTLVVPSPWDEQRRLFAPKYQFGVADLSEPDPEEEDERDCDVLP